MTERPATRESLWRDMQQAYKRAEERGAIYQIHSKPEKLTDEVLGLDFVLHVADALKDKPRAVPKRWAAEATSPAFQKLHALSEPAPYRQNSISPLAYHKR
jgi:hypothetical protein